MHLLAAEVVSPLDRAMDVALNNRERRAQLMAHRTHELPLLAPRQGQSFQQRVVGLPQLHHLDRACGELKPRCIEGVGRDLRRGDVELFQWFHDAPHQPAHGQQGEC